MENGSHSSNAGLLEPVPLDSRIFKKDILPVLQSSRMYSESVHSFSYTSAFLINSPILQDQYSSFRADRKEAGYTDRELEESFGFLLFDDENKAKELSESGLRVGHGACFTLGDPSKGVYVSKFSDCLDPNPWYNRKTGHIVLLRLIRGRVNAVPENYTQSYTQPTAGFDCHESEQMCSVSETTCSFLAYERTQYYLYELGPGGQEAKHPRQVCPFAIIGFAYGMTGNAAVTAGIEQQSYGPVKAVPPYRPWSGELQIGSLVYPMALRSSYGAMLPALLPAKLKINSCVRVSELRRMLPQAIFETRFTGEVCLEGRCCSLYAVVPLADWEEHALLTQEMKDKDLAFVLLLNDSGFLVLLHSSLFLTCEDTTFGQQEMLQGLFVFPDSRMVEKELKKSWRSKSLLPPEIIKALPGLSYAEKEVKKFPCSQQEALHCLMEQHLQNYANLLQSEMCNCIFPDQYDTPEMFIHLCSAPSGLEDSDRHLKSYLKQPNDYSLPVARVIKLLESRQASDLGNDVYYCVSSPEEMTIIPVESLPNGDSEGGSQGSGNAADTDGRIVIEEGQNEMNKQQQNLQEEDAMHRTADGVSPVVSENHGKFGGVSGMDSLNGLTDTTVAVMTPLSLKLPLTEAGATTEYQRVAPLRIRLPKVKPGRKVKGKRGRRRKKRVNTDSLNSTDGNNVTVGLGLALALPHPAKRKTYRYDLKTIITDCGRIFIPHGSRVPGHPLRSVTEVTGVMNIDSAEAAAARDRVMDSQGLLLDKTGTEVPPMAGGQASFTALPNKRATPAETGVLQTPCEDSVDGQAMAVETVESRLTVDRQDPAVETVQEWALPTGTCDTPPVTMDTAVVQAIGVAKGDGLVAEANLDTLAFPAMELNQSSGTQMKVLLLPNSAEEKYQDVCPSKPSTTHQIGKRKTPLCPISPTPALLGDLKESPGLSNAEPWPKRAKSCHSRAEVENIHVNRDTTAAAAFMNILQSEAKLKKALDPGSELAEQVLKRDGSPKVRTSLRRSSPRNLDTVTSTPLCDSTQQPPKSSSPSTVKDIEKLLVKPLKKRLRNRITKYMKENGWLSFDKSSSNDSDKLREHQTWGLSSAASGGRGGSLSGSLFVASQSTEVEPSQSPDALTLLADLALSASDDKLLQGLGPVLGAKLAAKGKTCGSVMDGGNSMSGAVFHTLLRHPLPSRRSGRGRRKLPIPMRSPPPKALVATGEQVLVLSREHSYSLPASCLVLGLSAPLPQVPPPALPHCTGGDCGDPSSVHERDSTISCQEGVDKDKEEVTSLPADSSGSECLPWAGRKSRFGRGRNVMEVNGSLRVTRRWKETYEFCLDSKYTNDPLDKAITRALHGPWDSSIEETFEQVRLILHMWIGLFYSRSTTRFFQMDQNGEILRGPSPNRMLHENDESLVSESFDFDTVSISHSSLEPEALDLREERKESRALTPPTVVSDLYQDHFEVLDLSISKQDREEVSYVLSDMGSFPLHNSLQVAEKSNDFENTDPMDRILLNFKEHRGSVDIMSDKVIEKGEDSSSINDDDVSDLTWRDPSGPPEDNAAYDELCSRTGNMCIVMEQLSKWTLEATKAREGTVMSDHTIGHLHDRYGRDVGCVTKTRVTYIEPCRFLITSSVLDMSTDIASDGLLEGNAKHKDDGSGAPLPVAVCDGYKADLSDINSEGGKDTEILGSTLRDQTSTLVVPLCNGDTFTTVFDVVETSKVDKSHVSVSETESHGHELGSSEGVMDRCKVFSEASVTENNNNRSLSPALCKLHVDCESLNHDCFEGSLLTGAPLCGCAEIHDNTLSSEQTEDDIEMSHSNNAAVPEEYDGKISSFDSSHKSDLADGHTGRADALGERHKPCVTLSASSVEDTQQDKFVSVLHSSNGHSLGSSSPSSEDFPKHPLHNRSNVSELVPLNKGMFDPTYKLKVTQDSLLNDNKSCIGSLEGSRCSSGTSFTDISHAFIKSSLSSSLSACCYGEARPTEDISEIGNVTFNMKADNNMSGSYNSLTSSENVQSFLNSSGIVQQDPEVNSNSMHNQMYVNVISEEELHVLQSGNSQDCPAHENEACSFLECNSKRDWKTSGKPSKDWHEPCLAVISGSKKGATYANFETTDNSEGIPMDFSVQCHRRQDSDLPTLSVEHTRRKTCGTSAKSKRRFRKTSKNSCTSYKGKIKRNDYANTIRSLGFAECSEHGHCDRFSSVQDPALHSSLECGFFSQQPVMAVRPSTSTDFIGRSDIQKPAHGEITKPFVNNQVDPDAKLTTVMKLKEFHEQIDEEAENKTYEECDSLLERESPGWNRLSGEDSGSEELNHSVSGAMEHCSPAVKSSKHNSETRTMNCPNSVYHKVTTHEQESYEVLDYSQANNIGIVSDHNEESEGNLASAFTSCSRSGCGRSHKELNRTLVHIKEEKTDRSSIAASSIVTVFDHKGNRMTYENHPILKPVSSGHFRTIHNSSTGSSHLQNFLQTWEELHLSKPDITQDTLDLECLIFLEKMRHIVKCTGKSDSFNRSSRYPWKRASQSSCNITPKISTVDRVITENPSSTGLPLSRWKIKVDLTERLGSVQREVASSMSHEPPWQLQQSSHEEYASNPSQEVSGITAECTSWYHEMMNDVCCGKNLPHCSSKPKVESRHAAGSQADLCVEVEQEMFNSLQDQLNNVVRLSVKTKFRFYILVTSADDFFEHTKELLVAEGHENVEPEQFDLGKHSSTSPLVIILRNEDITEHICTIPHLLELKKTTGVLFAGVDHPDDVLNLTHQELFSKGGFVVCDMDIFRTLPLDDMKQLVRVLEELGRKGKWTWLLHYRDGRSLKDKARTSKDAQDRMKFLERCQETGVVATMPYHDCDVTTSSHPNYLCCMLHLQAQHVTARFAVFITDEPQNSFGNHGILVMNINPFLQILRSSTDDV